MKDVIHYLGDFNRQRVFYNSVKETILCKEQEHSFKDLNEAINKSLELKKSVIIKNTDCKVTFYEGKYEDFMKIGCLKDAFSSIIRLKKQLISILKNQ